MLSRVLLFVAALELMPIAAGAQQPTNIDQYADEDPAALDDFRPDLDPYGEWVESPDWGTVYAGAWVDWSAGAWVDWSASVAGDGWAGWCPAPPQWRWVDRRPVPLVRQPMPSYTFVPQRDLFAPRFGGHALVGPRAAPIARSARTWSAPPAPRDFGFDPSRVPTPPADHPMLRHARQMAHPIQAPPARR